ncbi:hypothetical protein GCM10011390_41270 [Aureimonas endophytica]|uniref:Nucleoside phosphorylase domain-containing protein n=1 Tax=Aureimonas endophytica TaxID=2027858 RepID=A0A916ZXD2_9HYPH|nr:hypothetical protein [Aureimonas endophytica]GGE17834.1 hypothetical protein GCM10011390_41270 [Aureimonas endophytica]
MTPSHNQGPVLVVSGLAAEARIVAGPGVIAIAAPPSALPAKLAVLTEPPAVVVSFGLAGGLHPGLTPGMVVVPDRITAGDQTWDTTSTITRKLLEKLENAAIPIFGGLMACRDAPVLTAAAKSALHRETGAVAVDTESQIAAAYAAERGLPFIVLRAICDTAEADLPPLAIRAVAADGRLDWPAIGEELIHRPGQLLQLPGTALATLRAMRALGRVRRCLGPRLGL